MDTPPQSESPQRKSGKGREAGPPPKRQRRCESGQSCDPGLDRGALDAAVAGTFEVCYGLQGDSLSASGKTFVLPFTLHRETREDKEEASSEAARVVLSDTVLRELSTRHPVLLKRYRVLYANSFHEGWEELRPGTLLPGSLMKKITGAHSSSFPLRLDILLEDLCQSPGYSVSGDADFGIAMYQSKTAHNLVQLQRSASQLGVPHIFSVQDRFRDRSPLEQKHEGLTPIEHFDNLCQLSLAYPDYEWVAVEMGGTPLAEFMHPERAIYILGSEDNGVPKRLLGACRHAVELPSVRSQSFNVAIAGSMMLWDRQMKSRDPHKSKT